LRLKYLLEKYLICLSRINNFWIFLSIVLNKHLLNKFSIILPQGKFWLITIIKEIKISFRQILLKISIALNYPLYKINKFLCRKSRKKLFQQIINLITILNKLLLKWTLKKSALGLRVEIKGLKYDLFLTIFLNFLFFIRLFLNDYITKIINF
jgi:hypothetical protein